MEELQRKIEEAPKLAQASRNVSGRRESTAHPRGEAHSILRTSSRIRGTERIYLRSARAAQDAPSGVKLACVLLISSLAILALVAIVIFLGDSDVQSHVIEAPGPSRCRRGNGTK